jgi:glycerophosphoryl diester phosphodiesterase
LNSSFLLKEAAPLSHDLSRLGEIGLEALDLLRGRRAVPSDWARSSLEELDQVEKPRAEVVLAAVRPIRLLVRKAGGQSPHVAVISHRGEHLHHPENTIPAFEEAIRLGADFIEVDVRTTSDGKLVLSHDATVDRCTNGQGKIAGMTFVQVKALDAGVKFGPQFAGVRIPAFDEVLDLARGGIDIYVDVKNASASDLVSHIERHGMTRHVVVYCGLDLARQIRQLNADISVMPEADSVQHAKLLIEQLHPKVIAFGARDFQPAIIEVVKQAKAKVYVDRMGSADTPQGWQSAIDADADGIQTDRPGPLAEYLRTKGYK